MFGIFCWQILQFFLFLLYLMTDFLTFLYMFAYLSVSHLFKICLSHAICMLLLYSTLKFIAFHIVSIEWFMTGYIIGERSYKLITVKDLPRNCKIYLNTLKAYGSVSGCQFIKLHFPISVFIYVHNFHMLLNI